MARRGDRRGLDRGLRPVVRPGRLQQWLQRRRLFQRLLPVGRLFQWLLPVGRLLQPTERQQLLLHAGADGGEPDALRARAGAVAPG